ncbi:MAG: glycosyl hydrolase family 95 catalytic domain-containing protein [Eubacterium sp.]
MQPYNLVIDREIDRWDEGIPLGNGEMGCLLFGSGQKLIFSLDRGDIWDRSFTPEKTDGFKYSNLVKWAKSGDFKSISKTFEVPYHKSVPTKLPTGRFEITPLAVPEKCSFSLDMMTAESTFDGGDAYLKTYVHATKGVGMIKTDIREFTLNIVNPKFGKKSKLDNLLNKLPQKPGVSNRLKDVKYPAPEFACVDNKNVNIKYFIQRLNDGSVFGIAVGEKKKEKISELAYYAYYCKNVDELKNILTDKINLALENGYDALFESHKKWWEDYNSKSSITVEDEYIQNRYNMGNYLLGSASRKGCYPMPLQGLWTACDDKFLPPWKGDYHHDLNTELTYYSYLKANRLEQGECFLDYLASLTDRAREFAQSFYDADGICLPSVMDIDGYAMGGWAMYSLSPTNQLWLCQAFERYYTYTGNREFLSKTAYPFMSQSARFILSLLKEDSDGFYVLPLSSSPEIHDNSKRAFLKPNSNFDQSLMIYTFSALSRLAQILEKAEDKLLWDKTLSKLRPLAVNSENVLRISGDEDLTESHRHQSHAMAIHPLRLLDYSKKDDAKIIDATIAHAQKLGSSLYTGYSIAWIAEFFAVAKNGDKALEYLEIFWKYFCSVNTFHLNGDYTKKGYSDMHYRPFTLEGNFCALDVLQEMMLYSENGVIELFPAVAKKWENASFKTLRAWGGILVSAELKNSALFSAELYAENDVTFLLRGSFDNMTLNGGEFEKVNEALKITLKKGEALTILA